MLILNVVGVRVGISADKIRVAVFKQKLETPALINFILLFFISAIQSLLVPNTASFTLGVLNF